MTDTNGYECEKCGKVLPTKTGRGVHQSRCTQEPYDDPEVLRRLYQKNGLTQGEIGEMFGVTQVTIGRKMKEHGVEAIARGENLWKPYHVNHYTEERGYEVLAASNGRHVDKTLQHHRLLMVAEHGLDALRGKVVHHKNGIPWDNRVENLELMDPADHSRHHAYEHKFGGNWGSPVKDEQSPEANTS